MHRTIEVPLGIHSARQAAQSNKAEHVVTVRAPVCLLWGFLFALPFDEQRARLSTKTPSPTSLVSSPVGFLTRGSRHLRPNPQQLPDGSKWKELFQTVAVVSTSLRRERSRLVVNGESEPESALCPSAHAQRRCYLRHIPQRPLSSFFI